MTVTYSVSKYRDGEEILTLELRGEVVIAADIAQEREEIIEITFYFLSGARAIITTNDIRYVKDGMCRYELSIEAMDSRVDPYVISYEEEVLPYLNKIRDDSLTETEAKKIYDGLIETFKDHLKSDLDFVAEVFSEGEA